LKYGEKIPIVKKADQELSAYTKRNKPKRHTETQACVNFGCELYFDV
jgi:hypothetical protein